MVKQSPLECLNRLTHIKLGKWKKLVVKSWTQLACFSAEAKFTAKIILLLFCMLTLRISSRTLDSKEGDECTKNVHNKTRGKQGYWKTWIKTIIVIETSLKVLGEHVTGGHVTVKWKLLKIKMLYFGTLRHYHSRDSSVHCIYFLILWLEFLNFFIVLLLLVSAKTKEIHQASGLFLFSVIQVKKQIVTELHLQLHNNKFVWLPRPKFPLNIVFAQDCHWNFELEYNVLFSFSYFKLEICC